MKPAAEFAACGKELSRQAVVRKELASERTCRCLTDAADGRRDIAESCGVGQAVPTCGGLILGWSPPQHCLTGRPPSVMVIAAPIRRLVKQWHEYPSLPYKSPARRRSL